MPPRKKNSSDETNSLTVLNKALKSGVFSPVYLLYGEEDHLKQLYCQKMTEAIGQGNEMNVTRLIGDKPQPDQVIEAAYVLPFFADKRLIVVENSGWFKTGSGTEALADFIEHIPDTACIIFVEKAVDKRSKLYKVCAKVGIAAELGTQSEDQLIIWMAKFLKARKKNIRQQTAQKIIAFCGTDMNKLSRELDKLASYAGDRDVIEDADVNAICSRNIDAYMFDMTDAIINGDKPKAYALYYDLLSAKEDPVKIIVTIGKQFARLAEVAFCMEDGMGKADIAQELGIAPWLAEKLMRHIGPRKHTVYTKRMELAAQAQEDIVTGKTDSYLAAEILISEC